VILAMLEMTQIHVASHRSMKKPLDILIIEDVARDAELIEAELRAADLYFRARRVHDRSGFLKELSDAQPDLILSDFTLPEFDALQALQLLRERKQDTPFILVTGTRSEEVAVECIREGADDYILKASLKRLPTSIVNALQKRAAEQARFSAEAALRRSEEQYRLIAENTRDLIALVDPERRFLYASPSHRASLGYQPGSLVGTDFRELVHPEDRAALRQTWEQSLQRRESRSAEVRFKNEMGSWLNFESIGNWIFDERGRVQRGVIISRDISRRKLAEAALRELPRLIREAQEAERRRVARELHDSVNQILSAVKFRLQAVEERLQGKDETAWRDTLKTKANLEKAMQEVRRISRNLRPSELDDLGLAPAVRSLCREFGERTGITVELTVSRVPRVIPKEIELNLYRIIQEALGNIEKHARAANVRLDLSREGSRLRATIRDQGLGFDPLAPPRKGRVSGMGLVDMKERAAFVGGSCAVRSAAGTGTEIVIEMPLRVMDNSSSKPGEKSKAT
jgi:two-component system sensor histidine kinase UhpB